MTSTFTSNHIAHTSVPSNTQEVALIVNSKRGLDEIKNKLVYFDVETTQGKVYRAFGFVHEITTENPMSNEIRESISASQDDEYSSYSTLQSDMRNITLKVISVFNKNSEDNWVGGKPLPTSPSSNTKVYLATQDILDEMFGFYDGQTKLTALGTLRGDSSIIAPVILPYFGGNRGASSFGIVGKTGSGKTDFTSKFLINMFAHPDHCAIVVDPQGQWGNENGFTISVQKTAEAMGRKVHNLRVSENLQLPMSEENFMNMINQVDLWSKVGRMADENKELFSVEVAEIIAAMPHRKINQCKTPSDYRNLLTEVLFEIVSSNSTVARIYASAGKQESFVNSLLSLIYPAGKRIADRFIMDKQDYKEVKDAAILFSRHYETEVETEIQTLLEEEVIVFNDDEATKHLIKYNLSKDDTENARVDKRWDDILGKFIPLMNLFQSHNISGGKRMPFAGASGFLESILKTRNPMTDDPAPYVIFDMSPDVTNNAQAAFLSGKDSMKNMRKLLDNENIKASILMMVFNSLKAAAEEVFSTSDGNLNTQIIFDEAWRYAPEHSENKIVMKLSGMLEGFALDTRKFGIGWTYILQSPTDLRMGIWKQLKFVFSGYGLVGADLNRLADMMDDSKNQIGTYKQFVSPDLSGEYPFMLVGSVSPMITAQVPLFINSFSSVEDYFDANREWIHGLMRDAGKPLVEVESLTPRERTVRASESVKSHSVGAGASKASEGFRSKFTPSESSSTTFSETDPLAPPF